MKEHSAHAQETWGQQDVQHAHKCEFNSIVLCGKLSAGVYNYRQGSVLKGDEGSVM